MFSFLSKPQKQTPQTVLCELLKNASLTHSVKLSSKTLSTFKKFTKSIDLSGELLLAITSYIDDNADDISIVFKCLQILLYCLTNSHETVFPCTQAFAPEILTISLLSFQNNHNRLRKIIHEMALNIYNHSIIGEELRHLSSFGLDIKNGYGDIQRTHQQEWQHGKMQPASTRNDDSLIDIESPREKTKNDEKFGEVITFMKPQPQHVNSSKTDLLPEKDCPREPGAFRAFSSGRPIIAGSLPRGREEDTMGEEFGSLLSFDDLEPEEPEPPKEFIDDDGFVFGCDTGVAVSFAPFTDPTTGVTFDPFAKDSSAISSGFSPFTSNDEKYFASESSDGAPPRKHGPIVDFDDSFGSVQSTDDGELFDPFAAVSAKAAAAPQPSDIFDSFSIAGVSESNVISPSTAPFDNTTDDIRKIDHPDNIFDPFATGPQHKAEAKAVQFSEERKNYNNNTDDFDLFTRTEHKAGEQFDPFGQSNSLPSAAFDTIHSEPRTNFTVSNRSLATTGLTPVLSEQPFDPFGEFASSSKGSADSALGPLADPLSPKRPPGAAFLGARPPEPPKGINAFDLIEGIEDDVADPL